MNCTRCRKKFGSEPTGYPHQCPECGHTFTQVSMKVADVRDKAELFRSKLMRRMLEAVCDAMDGHDGTALLDLDNELHRQER